MYTQYAKAPWTSHHTHQLNLLLTKYCGPYKWGQNDCLSFVAEYVDRFTRIGVIERWYLDHWHRMSHANAILATKSHGRALSLMCDALAVSRGLEKISTGSLEPGDLLVVKSPVIVSGTITYPGSCVVPVGNGFDPLLRVHSGWRVIDEHGGIAAHYRPILKRVVDVSVK